VAPATCYFFNRIELNAFIIVEALIGTRKLPYLVMQPSEAVQANPHAVGE
jgi:hypothetical protein